MQKIKKYKKGDMINGWILGDLLGHGGNGEVWTCNKKNEKQYAIKILINLKAKRYQRFKDEIKILKTNNDIKGIVPIMESYLPEKNEEDAPYFVMTRAEGNSEICRDLDIIDKIEKFIVLCETIKKLHERDIVHRDIKPSNILYLDGNLVLADFGLVKFPNKKDISLRNEVIGPKWTMAPEMRRNPATADGKKADIYSLAKTLWILLTNENKGFEGQYNRNSINGLKKQFDNYYTIFLDELLENCTDNDPRKRYDINDFIDSLMKHKEINENFHERNMLQWKEVQDDLFPSSLPSTAIWKNKKDIIKILNILCSYSDLNHLFFPDGGGLDLIGASESYEDGCIELNFGTTYIIKPKYLIFESFNYSYEWNYFRIELEDLKRVKLLDKNYNDESNEDNIEYSDYPYQDISELSPGKFYSYEILEYYDENYEITDISRQIRRILKGAIVIFNKRSIYNRTSSTYDGRHNKMTTKEFRKYIEKNIRR